MSNQLNDIVQTSETLPMVRFWGGGNLTTLPDQYLLQTLQSGTYTKIRGYLHSGINDVFDLLKENSQKEVLYLRAVDNLIKKNDFLQLTVQLDTELITDDEFQHELEKNEDKYLIKMSEDENQEHLSLIAQILPKLKREFTADEVSELFSIPLEKIHLYIDSLTEKEIS